MILALLSLFATAAEPQTRIEIARAEWAGFQTDRIALRLQLRAFTKERTVLSGVRFERMSIGGVPFYLAPPPGPILLPAGEWVELPALPLTILLRDVHAMAAMRRMVESGVVTVKGTARFDIELPLLARILLLSWTASVAYPIDRQTAFPVPARGAVLALLDTIPNWPSLRQPQGWERSVMPIEHRYDLVRRNGQVTQVVEHFLGFLIAPQRMLTLGESAEPWLYDPAIAAATAMGDIEIRGSRLTTGGAPLRLLAKEIVMEAVFVPLGEGGNVRAQVARRASPKNMALFELSNPSPAPVLATSPSTDGGRATIARLDGSLIEVTIRWLDGRWWFSDPVDSSAIGSPVMTAAGVVGIVQDERSAGRIPEKLAQVR